MSLEQLTRISEPTFHVDNDVDARPIDIAQVKKELSQCEAALGNSMADAAGRQ